MTKTKKLMARIILARSASLESTSGDFLEEIFTPKEVKKYSADAAIEAMKIAAKNQAIKDTCAAVSLIGFFTTGWFWLNILKGVA